MTMFRHLRGFFEVSWPTLKMPALLKISNPAHRVLAAIHVNYGHDNSHRELGIARRRKLRRISRISRRANLRRP